MHIKEYCIKEFCTWLQLKVLKPEYKIEELNSAFFQSRFGNALNISDKLRQLLKDSLSQEVNLKTVELLAQKNTTNLVESANSNITKFTHGKRHFQR